MSAKRRKLPVRATVRVNAYSVVASAVEDACRRGYYRAHKHVEDPGEVAITSAIESAVMEALCEVLDFGEGA